MDEGIRYETYCSPDVLRCEDIETPSVGDSQRYSPPMVGLIFLPAYPYNIRSSHSSS